MNKNNSKQRIYAGLGCLLAILPVMGLSGFLLTGCGRSNEEINNYAAVESSIPYNKWPEKTGDDTNGDDITVADQSGTSGDQTDENSTAPAAKVYDTENILPSSESGNTVTNPVNLEFYADSWAYEHARDTDTLEYAQWLADYCVNVVEPQVVEMLMRVPLFRQAADEGLLSKYITLGLTYNDGNQFAAITTLSFLDKNGREIDEDDYSSKVRNIAQKICVNTDVYDEETQYDPAKQKELKDSLLHEMMHAIMADYTRNGGTGLFRDGSWAESLETANGFPDWFSEGCAICMQGGYAFSREDMLSYFFVSPDDPYEERLDYLSSAQKMYDSQMDYMNSFTEDEWQEITSDANLPYTALPVDLRFPENQYSASYFGTMYVFYLAARSMGLEPFDETGTIDMNVMMQGMEDVMIKFHNGYNLNQLVAEISKDPDTGIILYKDFTALEDNFLARPDEPSMIFVQKLMYDFESRIVDANEYIPCGSLIPGYNNYQKDFMDNDIHSIADVYGIVYSNAEDYADYYAVSTVRPSAVALTGGYRASYTDVPGLTSGEAVELDVLYTNNEAWLIDENYAYSYKSTSDWIRANN